MIDREFEALGERMKEPLRMAELGWDPGCEGCFREYKYNNWFIHTCVSKGMKPGRGHDPQMWHKSDLFVYGGGKFGSCRLTALKTDVARNAGLKEVI